MRKKVKGTKNTDKHIGSGLFEVSDNETETVSDGDENDGLIGEEEVGVQSPDTVQKEQVNVLVMSGGKYWCSRR